MLSRPTRLTPPRGVLFATVVLCCLVRGPVVQAAVVPVDLNDFAPFPDGAVAIAADGQSAVLYEDVEFAPVSLENLAFSIAPNDIELSFDYELEVAADNEDYFDFYIDDLSTPAFWIGGYAGLYEGHYSVLLADFFNPSDPETAVIFDLYYGSGDRGYESTLRISNVSILQREAGVPDTGATLLLLANGLAAVLAGRRLI